MTLVVEGASLRLRYPEPADTPKLFALGSDPEVTRYFSWGPYTCAAEALAFVESLPGRRARGQALELLIVDEAGIPLGLTGLFEVSPRDHRCVIGTWLGRQWWGTGVNAASKALMLSLAFETLGMERVTAWANVGNGRSRAALAKLGFRHEGVLREWHRHAGVAHDVAVLSLLRDEWAASDLARAPAKVSGRPPRPFIAEPAPAAVQSRAA
jgi:ribosomal-protein-alanine N-acetyltransferase